MVYEWTSLAQRWLWPRVCPLCGDRPGRFELCDACTGALPYAPRACRRCAAPLAAGELCAGCLQRPPPFSETVSPFLYATPVDALIQRLKFRGGLADARLLGGLLAAAVVRCTLHPPEVIVPVPLHRGRLARRGYNQALELARPVALRLGLPIDAHSCRRNRPTAAQSELAGAARAGNVAGAFSIDPRFGARRVAIVDDVMTTGHTVAALARALRGAGAEWVAVWACTRAAAGPA